MQAQAQAQAAKKTAKKAAKQANSASDHEPDTTLSESDEDQADDLPDDLPASSAPRRGRKARSGYTVGEKQALKDLIWQYIQSPGEEVLEERCAAGSCPSNDLMGGVLNSNSQLAAPFLGLNSSYLATASQSSSSTMMTIMTENKSVSPTSSLTMVSTSSPTTASISTTMSGVAISTTASPTPVATATAPQPSSNSTGAIAGGVVGDFAVLAALVLGLIYLLRRNRSSAAAGSQAPSQPVQDRETASMPGTQFTHSPTRYSRKADY